MTRWQAACGAVALACAAAGGAPIPAPRLAVVLADDTIVWDGPVRAGEAFDVAYEHSSERCRWTHHYEVGAGRRLLQLGSTFPCYGAGMPIASTDGSPVTRSAAGFDVAAPRALPRVPMMNSRRAAITLRHRARDVAIGDLVPDMDTFAIEVR